MEKGWTVTTMHQPQWDGAGEIFVGCDSTLGDVVVVAVLDDQEGGRGVTAVSHPMRAAGRHGEDVSTSQMQFLFRLAQGQPDRPIHDIEGVLCLMVRVPRDFLRGPYLQLGDAKPGRSPYRARRSTSYSAVPSLSVDIAGASTLNDSVGNCR